MKHDNICGVILAGGLARRMGGGRKTLLKLGQQTLLSHILECLTPQVREIAVNANGDLTDFQEFSNDVLVDSIAGFPGPLAGVLAGMDWVAEKYPTCRYLISVPGDGPFIPQNLVEKLFEPILNHGAEMSVAMSNQRTHPVVGIWDVNLRDQLRNAIVYEQVFKVDRWTSRFNIKEVDFSFQEIDPFFNINKPEDLKKAETIMLS